MYTKSGNAQNGANGPNDENYRNDENCENNKMNMNNYKNIMHNQKKKKLGLMEMDYLDKAVMFSKADKKGNNCVAGRGPHQDTYDGAEVEEEEEEDEEDEDDEDDDEDDEDYQVGDDEEDDEEDDDDDYEEEEYDDEVRQINFNSYNNYYYEAANAEEEGETNLPMDHQTMNKNEKVQNGEAKTDRKNELMFERYNKLLADYRSKKEQMTKEYSSGKIISKEEEAEERASCCYSCNSSDGEGGGIQREAHAAARAAAKSATSRPSETLNTRTSNQRHPNSEYYMRGENDNFIADVLNRIDQIYNKQSRYTDLKNVNNSNNNICINDLNLNIISDYLNVDISVFHKKTTFLLLGNPQSGKSSFINWFTESYVQNTNSIGKKNEITYVDIKNKFKFNFKRLNNANYQFGLLNRHRNRGGSYGSSFHYSRERPHPQMNPNHMEDPNEQDLSSPASPIPSMDKHNQSEKVILSGENCDYLFMPFQKLRKKAHNVKKYIFGKICYQNNLTKYMNRINSVSFLDTSGINDIGDVEYDEIIMNLSKYVDAIFLFLDSNQFSINNRLLRIINYLMDNQLNKVTICLTRIDMIQKINLYRVVFYLTQYFLRSLNLFRYSFANPNGAASLVDGMEMEPYMGHHTGRKQHGQLDWRGGLNWRSGLNWRGSLNWRNPLSKNAHMINEFFNRSIRSFQNVLLFPKMLTKMISRRATQRVSFGGAFASRSSLRSARGEVDRSDIDDVGQCCGEEDGGYNQGGPSYNEGLHSYGEADHYYGEEEPYQDDRQLCYGDDQSNFPTRHRKGERVQEKVTGEEETGGIFKKILTKSYNSFKDKILSSGNAAKGDICRLNSMRNGGQASRGQAQMRHTSMGHPSVEHPSMGPSPIKRVDPSKSNEGKLKTHLDKLFEKKINYGDCLKNISIFFLVLIYEVVTTIYSLIHTSINNYISRSSGARGRAVNVDKLYQLDEANKLKYTDINDGENNTYKVLEFLTIYLPEIPSDLLKKEKWKYEKGKVAGANRKYNNERRNRFSCNIQYQHDEYGRELKNDLCQDEQDNHMDNRPTNSRYGQRRSIPEEFLILGNGNGAVSRYGEYGKGNYPRGNYFPGVDDDVYGESFLKDIDYHGNGRSSAYLPPGVDSGMNGGMHSRMHKGMRTAMHPPIRNEDVRELNMIHELIFKIDETIDLKSNQSIYMLKRDLEKIRSTCLKKISDNEHVVKQNRSLRIQNLKFYFFKYMAIFFGFIISLLRYDMLVYFNFIKPELLFSIFSKYFLFLSSYNKNSLFIAVNILLVVAYLGLYVRYNRRNYFKSLGKSDLNKLKIILLFTQIIFDEINQLHLRLVGGRERDDPGQPSAPSGPSESNGPSDREDGDYGEGGWYGGYDDYGDYRHSRHPRR
ncbi:hypothetical protein C922_02095 [Plasmodium inui San Antonio 1]|uniref:G domain-containing protein n=1 Tax=Plasmodium inui San Antonio 1 TaxID=1237626 RepID=W7AE48_9APIC|nr:hypothetical protein C922_02095 [Plasmodium inui San Antonio 1]EUD67389.1 hypothetical protein C922_02095 [Plasmodium inui San Antonio 1]